MKKFLLAGLLLIMVFLTVSCNGDFQPPIKEVPDPFYTQGFTKGSTTPEDMIYDLVRSAFNTIRPLSVNDTLSGDRSMAAQVLVDLNGMAFTLDFKLNYVAADGGSTLTLEMRPKDSQNVTIGVYFYNTAENAVLYLSLNDNKIKITMSESTASGVLPLNYSKDLYATLELALKSFLKFDGDIKYEYKTASAGTVRHYLCKINLVESLKLLLTLGSVFSYDTSDIDFLLRSLIGVSIDDIDNKGIPETAIQLEFKTVEGTKYGVGNGKVAEISLDVDVESSANLNTVFKGEAFYAVIDLVNIEVSRSLLTNIKKQSELTGFVEYNDKAYHFEAELKYADDNTPYTLSVDCRFDGLESNEDRVAAYITDRAEGKNIFSLFYLNNRMYLNIMDGGVEKNLEADMDFNAFVALCQAFFANREDAGFMKTLVYILGSFQIEDINTISFTFVSALFNEIMGLNVFKIINLLDGASEDDFGQLLEDAGIDLETLFNRRFKINADLSTDLLTLINDVEFPEVLNKLN